MAKQRRVPMRMCVGCREMKPKKELLRVVRSSDGAIAFDPVGKASGRGAYVCAEDACLQKAIKTRALERQLEVKIGEEIYAALNAKLDEARAKLAEAADEE